MNEDLKKEVEALLFAAGRKVIVDELILLCKSEKSEINKILQELKKDYDEKDSSLFLIEEGDGWKMTVRDKYIDVVKEISTHTELNKSMLETLSIIAWKQPVLQSEVIHMRSSTAYEDIKLLLDMGFISKEKKGRSFILKPTGTFFDYFDLPSKEKLKEMFKDVEWQGKTENAQTQIGDIDTHPKKIGGLNVYEGKEGENNESSEPVEGETGEHLGKLDVVNIKEDTNNGEENNSEDNQESEDNPESKEVEETESDSTEETESDDSEEPENEKVEEAESDVEPSEKETSESEEPDEEPEDLLDTLAGEKREREQQDTAETTDDQEEVSESSEEKTTKESKKEKHRVSKELEEFAGTEEKLGED